MKMEAIKNRMDIELAGVHLIASLCMALGFANLVPLIDLEITERIYKYGQDGLNYQQIERLEERLTYLILSMNILPYVGLILAFVISLSICKKLKIYWVYPMLSIIISAILYKVGIMDYSLKPVLSWLISPLKLGISFKVLIVGSIALILSIYLFTSSFLKRNLLLH
jgi:hypothetical protein